MKVLIADDHWMIRSSLKHAIRTVNSALEPLEAGSFQEAFHLLGDNPDVELMLIDLMMPGLPEFEGLRSLRAKHPEVPVAIVSVHEDREHVVQAIAEGVIGYIPKSADGAEMLRALTLVLNGDVYFPRDILQGSTMRRQQSAALAARDMATPTLTSRESQVLELIAQARSNAEIAEKLGMSPNTVRVHVRNVGLKLNLKERSDLMAYGESYTNTRAAS